MLKLTAFSIAFVLSLYGGGIALQCFQCSSSILRINEGCLGTNLDKTFLKTCDVGEAYCIIQTNLGTINRSCSSEPLVNTCVTSDDLQCTSSCVEDGCNIGNGTPLKEDERLCYTCESRNGDNPQCETATLDRSTMSTCPEDEPFCMTYTIKTIPSESPGVKVDTIARRCSTFYENSCFTARSELRVCTSSCRGASCNSGDVPRI